MLVCVFSLLMPLLRTHTQTGGHTHIFISPRDKVSAGAGGGHSCHMLNHPSVAACLHITPGKQHTNTTKLRQTSSQQQFWSSKYNSNTWKHTCEKTAITAKISDKDWLWSSRTADIFAGFSYIFYLFIYFVHTLLQKVFISSPGCYCCPKEKTM